MLRAVRRRSVTVVLISASAYACRDATAPATGPAPGPAPNASRYYRLRPLIVPASGIVVPDGDLLLSADGTYATGLRDSVGSFDTGHWSGSDSALVLTGGAGATIHARVAGDTVQVQGTNGPLGLTLGLTFLRAPLAANPIDGTQWVLRSINGRTATNAGGIVLVDTTGATNERFVARVSYDTLAFTARRFVRRSRAESDSSMSSRFGVYGGTSNYSAYGGVDVAAGTIVVRLYGGGASTVAADTLRIDGDMLVRRSHSGFGAAVEEDRYARLP